MQIVFDKVADNPKPFRVEEEGVVFDGTLQQKSHHRVSLNGALDGSVEVQCNRCGRAIDYALKAPIALTISDQIVEDKDDLDIIEFLDGKIDLSFILKSEINTLKSEYHYCNECNETKDRFEMEF